METIVEGRIAGTRITVWDVLHHHENHWSMEDIADVLGLSIDQVQAAMDYIQAHADDVMKTHRSIEERNARGNPPDVQAKLTTARAKRIEWLKERKDSSVQERQGVGNRR
jgi:uncharacterized protein (DUF433 family)